MIDRFKPVAYDKGVLYAARALFEGKANEGQQQRFMEWLTLNLCHIGEPSMHENDRVTAFLEGQRSVGLQVAKLRSPEALALIEGKRGKRQPNE